MPETTITKLPHSEVKISFAISLEEAQPYIDEAVKEIGTAKTFPGFRPGKAPYEIVKREVGEMRILEQALERIVRAFYVKTVLEENIDTIGSPAIAVDQLTPGQIIKFTMTAPVAPTVLTFPNLVECTVRARQASIKDAQVEESVQQMRKMRRQETRVDRGATLEDLALIDLEMKRDHVVLEGGSGKDYRVFLAEDHYIPGFAKQLEGIKEGEERTFTLPFPTEHYQKHLAGQPVDFTAKAKAVFALTLSEANDEFAKGVGIESMEKLRELLKTNLQQDAQQKADEAAEIELLDKLTDKASFSEIPDLLVNEEVKRMVHELEHGVEEQGMKWPDYLASVKKTIDELKLDFVPQAMRRIKAAILIKQIAKKEKVEISDQELDQEVDRILDALKPDDKDARERVASPDYRDYVAVQMRNRKALEWLKKQCIQPGS